MGSDVCTPREQSWDTVAKLGGVERVRGAGLGQTEESGGSRGEGPGRWARGRSWAELLLGS